MNATTIRSITGHSTIDAARDAVTTDAEVRPAVNVYDLPIARAMDTKSINPVRDRVAARSAELNAPSEKQINMIGYKLDTLAAIDPEGHAAMVQWLDRNGNRAKLTGGKEGTASQLIGRLIARIDAIKSGKVVVSAPTGPAADTNNFDDVPDGYYALAGDGDVVKFYRINTEKHGQWNGVRFVKAQASDEFHNIRNAAARTAIFTAIRTVGVKAAMGLYGQHIGSCGRCHRTLTDADSRARGIGPDCWEKM
jgi:hypothetical protein